MPKMGDGMEEGQLIEWLKKDGEKVRSGEVIGSIQTDKATLELESPGTGVLTGYLIEPGMSVPVGRPIALVLEEGESMPEGWGSSGWSGASPAAPATPAAAPAPAVEEELILEPAPERVKASPLARKIAQEAGIDLASIVGSGPGGRIVERDVREAIAKKAVEVVLSPAGQVTEAAPDKKVALNRIRSIIAERTQQSKREAPHFYVTVEVDLEKVIALRELFAVEKSGKVSINDFVVKAVASALKDMPEVNSSYRGDHILRHGAVHIGIAAAVDEGLLVPVIKNAHLLNLRELATKSKELVVKAREGKLLPDEMSGSTFSISNMGMLDVDNFSAIINTPNSGIIAISSARKRAVVGDEDEIEVRWRMNITGSFDHRVLDGAVGAKFMNAVKAYLENPTRLLA